MITQTLSCDTALGAETSRLLRIYLEISMPEVLLQQDGVVLFDAVNSMEESLVVYDGDGYLLACNQSFSVIMIDIDQFKEVNDSHGHITGDQVILELANTIKKVIRNTDVAGRIGGDEFAIVLPEIPVDRVRFIAERLRSLFSEVNVPVDGEDLHFTISLGITEKMNGDNLFEDVMSRADDALYQAKQQGRNNVVVF